MKASLKNKLGRRRGFCLMESIIGGMVLVTLTLFLIDAMALISVHMTQDRVTYNAARIAANCADTSKARDAAQGVLTLAKRQGGLVTNVDLINCNYVKDHRVEVGVRTRMRLPAPIPGVSDAITFRTDAITPIVATPIVRF